MLGWRWKHLSFLALLPLLDAIVDEAGRYRAGGDITDLAPPEPTEEDRNASVDLSKQPIEKIFRLLAYELTREERRPAEPAFRARQFQDLADQACEARLVFLVQEAARIAEELRVYHLNVTGTSGLYWVLHKYPEEHSWAWLIAVSQDRVMRKVEGHLARLQATALDDPGQSCLSPGFRTVLMNAAVTWKKIAADHVALLWNGVAFGVLGDVTSWRELDEEGLVAEPGPGGPPPNVSWSENLIFANMWISSVQRWLQHHAQELAQAAGTELARAQAGLPREEHGQRWLSDKDGVLPSFEFLRRQLWEGWELDKGFLRAFLKHCLRPGFGDSARVSVADLGAGGGQYSEWLNDTGLVEAVAFDATQAVQDITGGRVQEINMAREVQLWRTFDWVLCLDVTEHLPLEHNRRLLQNVKKIAGRGLVASLPSRSGDGPDLVSLVEAETGLAFDAPASELLRRGSGLERLAQGVAVFSKS